ncbi:hypothetical protein NT2_06_01690 [Caenibius tardaugens NBRC 16725]|uniref:Phasin domain-containing protein n=2 Tax=Caenibius TaxID=2827482 RepID=U2ZWH8_9SPHN|nr:hypothetical protein NT2_06_01690 [Caenibius tardaugens NBRC 16725]
MTYPVDQILHLMKANGQFMLKLADITRGSSQEYAQIGTKAASEFANRFQTLQLGKVPSFDSEGAQQILSDMQKVREETLGQVRGVFEEWQGAWSQFVPADGQKQFADTVQGFFTPFLNKGEEAKPAPVKAGTTKAE